CARRVFRRKQPHRDEWNDEQEEHAHVLEGSGHGGFAGEKHVVEKEVAGPHQEHRHHEVRDGRAEIGGELVAVDGQQARHAACPSLAASLTYRRNTFSSVGCRRSRRKRRKGRATARAMAASMPSLSSTWHSTMKRSWPAAMGRMATSCTPSTARSAARRAAAGASISSRTPLVCSLARCRPAGESTASRRPWLMIATRRQISVASARMWVLNTTAWCSPKARGHSRVSWICPGSSPAVGSSSSNTLG